MVYIPSGAFLVNSYPETPIRYDTDNIGIADIIDDIDTIDPSLIVSIKNTIHNFVYKQKLIEY